MPHCLLSILLILACDAPSQPQSPPLAPSPKEAPQTISVEIAGALFKMMHQGDRSRKAELEPLKGQANLYGLGAMEGLNGEVSIWNGQVWISQPAEEGEIQSHQAPTASDGATLLVTATVPKWHTRSLPQAIDDSTLESLLLEEAKALGISTEEAFPFTLEGKSQGLQWHVMDGRKIPEDAHGHEAHIKTAIQGTLTETAVQIIGFYSPKHHGVFTHHDANVHAHVISTEANITGHVDKLGMSAGAKLSLPKM